MAKEQYKVERCRHTSDVEYLEQTVAAHASAPTMTKAKASKSTSLDLP